MPRRNTATKTKYDVHVSSTLFCSSVGDLFLWPFGSYCWCASVDLRLSCCHDMLNSTAAFNQAPQQNREFLSHILSNHFSTAIGSHSQLKGKVAIVLECEAKCKEGKHHLQSYTHLRSQLFQYLPGVSRLCASLQLSICETLEGFAERKHEQWINTKTQHKTNIQESTEGRSPSWRMFCLCLEGGREGVSQWVYRRVPHRWVWKLERRDWVH